MKVGMLFFGLFISVFFLVGFGMLGWGIRSYLKGQTSRAWPTSPGVLTDCELVEDSDSEGTTWQVKVKYQYEAAGSLYTSERLAFGYGGSSTKEEHRAIYDKLISGAGIVVRYDPNDPAESVIAAGFNRSTLIVLIFAATWLLFCTGFTALFVSMSGKDMQILNQITIIP